MQVPKQTFNIIKQFEGIKLSAYKDISGNLTIGIGHYDLTSPTVVPGMIITEQQADSILSNDLEHILSLIQSHISVNVTDNQLAALISFAFNLGQNALINSTLLKELNNGNMESAADAFLLWDHSNGAVVPGLARRRAAERTLFLTPDTEVEIASN